MTTKLYALTIRQTNTDLSSKYVKQINAQRITHVESFCFTSYMVYVIANIIMMIESLFAEFVTT